MTEITNYTDGTLEVKYRHTLQLKTL